jgi:hypothetical protein
MIAAFCMPIFSQETTLSNKDVAELVKAGLSESIIVSKIKNSQCGFDTSSNALIELKNAGASENIILAVIECKKESKPVENKSELILNISDAKGKRKVFIESEDEQSELEIAKQLKKKGFEVVSNSQNAELIFKFEIAEIDKIQVGVSPGIFGGINTSSVVERPEGKLTVYLIQDKSQHLVFAKRVYLGFSGKILHKQAGGLTEDFIKALLKAESSR